MPVSNGILLKTHQFHTNIVQEKPVSMSIADRFRAIKNKRIRDFDSDEIVGIFQIFLSSLTLNSKPIITDLTIIAGEQRVYCQGIAHAICDRIIEVPVDRKLPSLYLLDSIVKNIGKEYTRHFSARLPEVFCHTYVQVDPNMQRAMRRLFGTWGTVFPSSVLDEIKTRSQFSPSLNAQSSTQNSLRASQSPRSSNGVHVNSRSHYGNATVNTMVAKSASLVALKKSLPAADIVLKYTSPNRTGIGSPSSSHKEYIVDSSLSASDSPSHGPTDYKPSRVVDRKQTDEWQARDRDLKTRSVDLRGHRALISAYGMDEREKNLKRKHQKSDTDSAKQKIRMTWQNTEEEEFDWEEDRKRGSEIYPSMPPLGGNLTAVPGTNYRGRASFSLPAVGQKLSVIGNLPNGKLGDAFNTVPTFNLSYDPLATEIRLTDGAASTNSWHPSISRQFPPASASPMQIRGHFGDQHLNEPVHFEHQLDGSRSTPQVNSSQLPNYRPLPLHMQNPALASQVQPNSLIHQDVRLNLPLPPNASAPSHQLMPPPMYAYRGHGPTSSSIPAWPNPNAPNYSFNNIRGPVYPFPVRGPHPITNPSLNIGQSTSQVNPNTQPGGALSGLFSSLVSHGLISLNKQDSVGVDFDADNLKIRHESAITALYANLPRQCTTCGLRFVSQDEHSKHMDWHVTKNRTLNNRRTKPSPKWFVGVDMWLSGAEAVGAESAPGFLPAENPVEKKEDEEMAVPADEDQNTCALCGEPFEDFYSDDTEEWMYKGATYMYATGGTVVGVDRSQLGPIVHVKCRSDSNGLPSDERGPTESLRS